MQNEGGSEQKLYSGTHKTFYSLDILKEIVWQTILFEQILMRW